MATRKRSRKSKPSTGKKKATRKLRVRRRRKTRGDISTPGAKD
jgi:hypothetical protein